jgi:hypothetical protein
MTTDREIRRTIREARALLASRQAEPQDDHCLDHDPLDRLCLLFFVPLPVLALLALCEGLQSLYSRWQARKPA